MNMKSRKWIKGHYYMAFANGLLAGAICGLLFMKSVLANIAIIIICLIILLSIDKLEEKQYNK